MDTSELNLKRLETANAYIADGLSHRHAWWKAYQQYPKADPTRPVLTDEERIGKAVWKTNLS